MEKYDPRVDAYIQKSAEFAQPILSHIRQTVHRASAHITETIKWGFPFFEYKGPVCSMASFKAHCALGFWKSSLLSDPDNVLQRESREAMGQFGRIRSIDDLPSSDILLALVREAMELNERGVKVSKLAEPQAATIQVPHHFQKLLNEHSEAGTNFEKLSNSHQREYIQWFEEAKTDATRIKRMTSAIEWIKEGKGRNWKYERKG